MSKVDVKVVSLDNSTVVMKVAQRAGNLVDSWGALKVEMMVDYWVGWSARMRVGMKARRVVDWWEGLSALSRVAYLAGMSVSLKAVLMEPSSVGRKEQSLAEQRADYSVVPMVKMLVVKSAVHLVAQMEEPLAQMTVAQSALQ